MLGQMHIHAIASGEEMVYDTCDNSDNELDDVLKGELAAFTEDAGGQFLFFWI